MPSLPLELVTVLLQRASQQERLIASGVCSSWKAAGLAATSEVVLATCSSSQLDRLMAWLSAHQHALPNLTSLQLELQDKWRLFEYPALPCRHLRKLQLHAFPWENSTCIHATPLRLATLQACAGTLTQLDLTGYDLSIHTADSLGQLTALQELELRACTEIDAAALLGISSLKSLSMHNNKFKTYAALPDLLAQQQAQLTRLELDYLQGNDGGPFIFGVDAEWCQQLAAQLTASSSLQHLNLNGLELTPTAWQQMFPEERRPLPHLTYLWIPSLYDRDADDNPYYQLNAADIHALARCCPALQALESGVAVLLQPALSTLSHLTSVRASMPEDGAALQVVTALTGLQRLHLYWCKDTWEASATILLKCSRLTSLGLTRYGLVDAPSDTAVATIAQLTNLAELDLSYFPLPEAQLLLLQPLVRLSNLSVSTGFMSPAFCQFATHAFGPPTVSWSPIIKVQASPGGAPDVWQQLLSKCFPPYVAGLQQQIARQDYQLQQFWHEQEQHVNQLMVQQQQLHQHSLAALDRDVGMAELRLENVRLRRQLQQGDQQQLDQHSLDALDRDVEMAELRLQLARLQRQLQQGGQQQHQPGVFGAAPPPMFAQPPAAPAPAPPAAAAPGHAGMMPHVPPAPPQLLPPPGLAAAPDQLGG